jgi:mRNA interferase RelE/StbE
MASYRIEISKRVRKDFRLIPKKDAERILLEIQKLADEPQPVQSKKLKGEDLYRLRIGVYRVIYEIIDDRLIITVVKVGHRKDIYRN